MHPLVSVTEVNSKYRNSAIATIVLLAIFGLLLGSLALIGQVVFIAVGVASLLFFGWIIWTWVDRVRRASGAAPVLMGEPASDRLVLKGLMPAGRFGSPRVPRAVAIPRGGTIWLTEEAPDTGAEFITGIQPYRYWLRGEGVSWAFASFSRVRRADFGPLESALHDNGNTVHTVLERSHKDGPLSLAPVEQGSPTSVTLAVADGMAVVGAYSGRRERGWVPREHAYAYAVRVPWPGQLAAVVTFSREGVPSADWAFLGQTTLPAYADTLVLATGTGVPQVFVSVPSGFSSVQVFRRVTATGAEVHVQVHGSTAAA